MNRLNNNATAQLHQNLFYFRFNFNLIKFWIRLGSRSRKISGHCRFSIRIKFDALAVRQLRNYFVGFCVEIYDKHRIKNL